MLRTNDTGNFREADDGDGRTTYNGYMYANELTEWMNNACSWNQQMNIPTGNSTPVIAKNFFFVSGAINLSCDDGCSDTPRAWDITSPDGCSNHPACGWNTGGQPNCSNNLMDYNGSNALTPCQIGIIHSSLEGGMRTYLSCADVSRDLSLCDIGYPKVSYFGKIISLGCVATPAVVSNNEKIKVYFSNSVELTNFEVSNNSEFEVVLENTCTF
jgi:hypothetical protein